ncbi:HAMP domain-containing sensor histidine kinase [Clostridiaceae bacterium 35-E11]
MKISLAKKLVFSFLLAVLAAILITSFIANYMIDTRFDEYLLNVHKEKINKVKKLVEELYDPQDPEGKLNEGEIQRYAMLEDLYIQINDGDGNEIFSSGQAHLIHKKMMGSMMNRRMGRSLGEYMEEKFSIVKNQQEIGTLIIGYFGEWNTTERDIGFKDTLNQAFFISIVAAIVFAFGISLILSRELTTPLVKITKVANQMRDGNLTIRSEGNFNTKEIHELSTSMNYLAETLQQQEMLRKRMTSDMAHEIRTPLTTLQTHVEALMDGVWEPTVERFESCHEEILRLTKMVDNLQDLARLEQANLHLNKTNFNLSAVIQRVIETFQPQYKKKNMEILTNITPGIEVLMDKDKIKQIMFNLLSNAYKYSKQEGKVEVVLKFNEKEILFSVKDEGIGISKEDLSHIFERFYRGEASRSRETGGAGIGLTITKTLIEAHGGKITVESEIGKGSIFTIKIPKSMEG